MEQKQIDVNEVRKWHDVFKSKGELFEIRLLSDKIYSGYFSDVESAINAIIPFDNTGLFQIYFTINEINPACSSRRQFGNFMKVTGSATSKNDIVRRSFLPVDIDVSRPSDVSSTDEEKAYAHKKAQDVYRFMQSAGFSGPIVCDSSSGYHLYYPIDAPNDLDTENLVKQVYAILSANFTDTKVKIDSQVGDANRIMRLPGSWGRKGRDSEERPHRLARILSVPSKIVRTDIQFLRSFVERYKVEEERPAYRQYQSSNEQFDLKSFMQEHGLVVRNEAPYGVGGVKYVLEQCPFDSQHHAPDSAIFVSPSGAIAFKCFHDSCAHHTWHELRQMLDPTAYEQKERFGERRWDYKQQYKQYKPYVPDVQVQEETPDLGKKWLDLSDVEDINLDDIQRISTGFSEIDFVMGGGLFLGETTIVSGINGSGKSAWLNTIILNAINRGFKSALWTGELRAPRLKRWLIQAAAGTHVRESMKSKGKYYVEQFYIDEIVKWLKGKFFLYNNDYSSDSELILSSLDEVVSSGVKFIVLDNLFSMDLTSIEGSENEKQKSLILKIADFSKKNQVHTILVAHPRKVVTFLRKEDILGTSALQNAVDNIFIFHRRGKDFMSRALDYFDAKDINPLEKYGNVVEISKNREFGTIEKLIGIYFNPTNRHFYDDNGERPYGWDAAPIQSTMTFNSNNDDDPLGSSSGDAPF